MKTSLAFYCAIALFGCGVATGTSSEEESISSASSASTPLSGGSIFHFGFHISNLNVDVQQNPASFGPPTNMQAHAYFTFDSTIQEHATVKVTGPNIPGLVYGSFDNASFSHGIDTFNFNLCATYKYTVNPETSASVSGSFHTPCPDSYTNATTLTVPNNMGSFIWCSGDQVGTKYGSEDYHPCIPNWGDAPDAANGLGWPTGPKALAGHVIAGYFHRYDFELIGKNDYRYDGNRGTFSFDVASTGISGAQVHSAQLTFSDADNDDCHLVLEPANEDWSGLPATVSENRPSNDASISHPVFRDLSRGLEIVDVTTEVQQWLSGSRANLGWIFRSTEEGYQEVRNKCYAHAGGFQLKIVYHPNPS